MCNLNCVTEVTTMNFYIVPPGLYQTQQLMKNQRRQNRKHSKSSGSSDKSLRSISLRRLSGGRSEGDSNPLVKPENESSMLLKSGTFYDHALPQASSEDGNSANQFLTQRPHDSPKTDNKEKPNSICDDEERILIPKTEELASNRLKFIIETSDATLRYKTFLNIVSGQEENDPIYYSKTRNQSIQDFTYRIRLQVCHNLGSQYPEDRTLGHEYLGLRSQVEAYILSKLSSEHNKSKVLSEEIIQRILYLFFEKRLVLDASGPECRHGDIPQSIDNVHCPSFLEECLVDQDKAEPSGETRPRGQSSQDSRQKLAKINTEFVLLEHYFIQLLEKLGNGFLIDRKIIDHLLSLFELNLKLDNPDSIKILNFNTHMTSHYSWYLAISIPFARIFEISSSFSLGIPSEERGIETSLQRYISELDYALFKSYFSQLSSSSFTKKRFLRRSEMSEQAEISQENAANNSTKPPNFDLFSQSLDSLPDETFHVVHSRELDFLDDTLDIHSTFREFYRILKKGGLLEIPLHIFRESSLQLHSSSNIEKGQKEHIKSLWTKVMTPIFASLTQFFEADKVQMSAAITSSTGELHSFISRFITLKKFDLMNIRSESMETDCHNEEGLFVYLRAEKT